MNSAGPSAFPLTPMDERGIDETAFAGLVARLAEAGVYSIGALGSTGNYPYPLLLAPVSYQPLHADEVFELYADVDRHVTVPLCVYDNPSTTQCRACCARSMPPPGIGSTRASTASVCSLERRKAHDARSDHAPTCAGRARPRPDCGSGELPLARAMAGAAPSRRRRWRHRSGGLRVTAGHRVEPGEIHVGDEIIAMEHRSA